MQDRDVHFIWSEPHAARSFRTGVCLHGHTLYSQECLSFLPRYLHQVPGISQVVRGYEKPRPGTHAPVDFARAWWTPPLTPSSALHLERKQIAKLGLDPIVSLSDHDEIEACMVLQVAADRAAVPVSVEWTVPYGASIIHVGIHNLPPREERSWMAAMACYTAAPSEAALPELLCALSAIPETLVVLNHPYWLEEGVTEAGHRVALDRLLRECTPWLHAIELNGTRPWKENAAAIALGRALGRPVISGGDRHGCEPAACVNLTNATSFSEFVAEVRGGVSTVLFMPQYREALTLRILETSWDILRPYPDYPGRERWTDRVFYRGDDGVARPLSVVWNNQVPWMLRGASSLVQLAASTRMRSALRLLLLDRGEALP